MYTVVRICKCIEQDVRIYSAVDFIEHLLKHAHLYTQAHTHTHLVLVYLIPVKQKLKEKGGFFFSQL